jgi:hypothetical protein
MIFMAARSLGGLGEQGHRPRAADCARQLPLVPGAATRDAARRDLAPLRDEISEATDVLVVDQVDPIYTELANLAAPEPAPLDGLRSWRNGLFLLLEPRYV